MCGQPSPSHLQSTELKIVAAPHARHSTHDEALPSRDPVHTRVSHTVQSSRVE